MQALGLLGELVAIWALIISGALSAQHAPPSTTPRMIERMIVKYGATQTVAKLTWVDPNAIEATWGRYGDVLDGVASGDSRWLALVPKLDPGTDAGSAEFLRLAVAEALPKNPAGVLRFTSRLSWFRDACGFPMIEPTRKEIRSYFAAAIPAVKSVRDPALQTAKRVCLAELMKVQRTPYP